MPISIQALREARNALAKDINDLLEKHPERLPADVQNMVDEKLKNIEDIDGQIALIERAHNATLENADANALRDRNTKTPGAHSTSTEDSAALRAFLVGGLSNLSTEQRQRMAARQNPDIRNAMSTTVGAEGGFTVEIEYMRELEQAMKAYGGMRQVARVLPTATGATFNFPTADATSEVGAIVGQNATVGAAVDTTFGNVAIGAYKYTSRPIALPFELIQDSFIDIEGYIRDVLAMRLGRITSQHFTTGTGTNQPRGVVTGAPNGATGATGSTTSVTYDSLVNLQHSIDPAYRESGRALFMFHDNTLRDLRKVRDSQNRPIFVPGYEAGVPGGAPDRLLGSPIVVNQDMPTMAANARSILFGDFQKYVIRDVMDLTMFRMSDSKYVENGQIGFVAFMRSDGNLVDVGGAIKHYANSAS